jgi:hypothetical protein
MEDSASGGSPVTTAILRYLIEHPDAKDTASGIARWWLSPHHDEWKRDVIQTAIDGLVARGWLIRRETTPSHVVYGLDKQHLETITKLIAREE